MKVVALFPGSRHFFLVTQDITGPGIQSYLCRQKVRVAVVEG